MPPWSSRAAACTRSELEPRRVRNGPAYGPKFRRTAATAQTSTRTPPCGRPRPRWSSWSPGRTAGPDGWRLAVAQRFSNLGWGTQLRRHTNQLQSRPDSQFRVSTRQVTLDCPITDMQTSRNFGRGVAFRPQTRDLQLALGQIPHPIRPCRGGPGERPATHLNPTAPARPPEPHRPTYAASPLRRRIPAATRPWLRVAPPRSQLASNRGRPRRRERRPRERFRDAIA